MKIEGNDREQVVLTLSLEEARIAVKRPWILEHALNPDTLRGAIDQGERLSSLAEEMAMNEEFEKSRA